MAFPLLAVLLPKMRAAARSGRSWTRALEVFLAGLDDQAVKALELEMLDLDAFVTEDEEVETMLFAVLRLGVDAPGRLEFADVGELMAEVARRALREDHARWERAWDATPTSAEDQNEAA